MPELDQHFDEIDRRFELMISRLDRLADDLRDLRREILLWGIAVIAGLVGVIAAIFINGSPA